MSEHDVSLNDIEQKQEYSPALWGSLENLLVVAPDHTISVSVYLYLDEDDLSMIHAITEHASLALKEVGLKEVQISSEWTIPNSYQIEKYREDVSFKNPYLENIRLDSFWLQDIITKRHLVDLRLPFKSFKFERINGTLTIHTFDKIKSLHPRFYDALYSRYLGVSCLA